MEISLSQHLLFITGAGQGLGAALAAGFAAAGAGVVITDISGAAAAEVAAAIQADGGQAWSYQLDVTNADACAKLSQTVAAECGEVSILINNAGICPRNSIDSEDVRTSWQQGLAVNLNGPLNATLAVNYSTKKTRK